MRPSIPTFFATLAVIVLMWSFHVKWLSTITPRNLVEFTWDIIVLFIDTCTEMLLGHIFLRDLNMIKLVFVGSRRAYLQQTNQQPLHYTYILTNIIILLIHKCIHWVAALRCQYDAARRGELKQAEHG